MPPPRRRTLLRCSRRRAIRSLQRTASRTDPLIFPIPMCYPPIRSARAAAVARWFGLPDRRALREAKSQMAKTNPPRLDPRTILPAPGTITLLTGPSGAGKSTLLRRFRAPQYARGRRISWIDLAHLPLRDVPIVDCFEVTERTHRDDDDASSLQQTLLDLGRVGLAEAWSYLRTPRELSEGQRWRLRLALAMRVAASNSVGTNPPRRTILFADEFAAVLDRVTATIVARCLRRAIDASPATTGALVATSHRDLIAALQPDVIIDCDFGMVEIHRTESG